MPFQIWAARPFQIWVFSHHLEYLCSSSSIFEWSGPFQNQPILKQFGIQMGSEFEYSVFKPPLYFLAMKILNLEVWWRLSVTIVVRGRVGGVVLKNKTNWKITIQLFLGFHNIAGFKGLLPLIKQPNIKHAYSLYAYSWKSTHQNYYAYF